MCVSRRSGTSKLTDFRGFLSATGGGWSAANPLSSTDQKASSSCYCSCSSRGISLKPLRSICCAMLRLIYAARSKAFFASSGW